MWCCVSPDGAGFCTFSSRFAGRTRGQVVWNWRRFGWWRARTKLDRQRQFFQSLLENSPVAIITTDLDATVTSWNPQQRLFGFTREEAVGKVIDALIAATPDLREDAERVNREALAEGRYEGVARRSRKDGTVVDVEVLAVPIEVDGEQVGFYAIYHDVSELQRREALLPVARREQPLRDRDRRRPGDRDVVEPGCRVGCSATQVRGGDRPQYRRARHQGRAVYAC